MVPTGSKDPFALRRAAQGIVKILVEAKLAIPLKSLMDNDFMRERIQYYFREIRGFKYDEVNAVMAAGISVLADAEARLAALAKVRPTPNFEPLAASFKRINNILRQTNLAASEVNVLLLEEGPEKDLYYASTQIQVATLAESISTLRPVVDKPCDGGNERRGDSVVQAVERHTLGDAE